MKLSLAGASLLATLTLVISLPSTIAAVAGVAAATPNVVSVGFTKERSAKHGLLVKRSLVNENVTNDGILYWANVEAGTPPQMLTLDIDTGSSDTWFLANDSGNICTLNEPSGFVGHESFGGPCYGGFYNSTESSTYTNLDPDLDYNFYIEYADGSTTTGSFFSDDLTLGNATIKSLQMGLSANTTMQNGILGLSYDTQESMSDGLYPSLMDQLVKQNIINAPVYSLFLDELNSTTGSILFGGVDTEKFTGQLSSVPLIPNPNSLSNGTGIDAFFVSLSNFGANGNMSGWLSEPVVLDSGTSYTYLPGYLLDPIAEYYGGASNIFEGQYTVGCDVAANHPNDYLEFRFGLSPENMSPGSEYSGPSIRVPLSDIIVDLETSFAPTSNTTLCGFGFVDSLSVGVNILGDTFLRSAYVVYDLKNNEVGFAQAYFGSSESCVVEIQANATTIPALCGTNGPPCSTDNATSAGDVSSLATPAIQLSNSTTKSSDSGREPPAFGLLGSLAAFILALFLQ